MAENTYKTLQTRISLKHDTFAKWTSAPGKDLILLPGEIGICTISEKRSNDPTVQTPAPTVLFKVGDGTHTFENLKWASALAADVHDWAKAETVVLDGTSMNDNLKHFSFPLFFLFGGSSLTLIKV